MTFLRKLKFVYIVAISLLSLQACALIGYDSIYSAKSTEVWVVDADTNKPVEGVTAVAHWELPAGTMTGHGGRIVQLEIMETVTDKGGRVYFPAWGPKPNPLVFGYFQSRDPEIILFKSGYKPEYLYNYTTPLSEGGRRGELRYSDWDGKTIKLKKTASNASYLDIFQTFIIRLDSLLRSQEEPCNWKRAPAIVAAMMAEEHRLKEGGVSGVSFLISGMRSSEEYFSKQGCGSVNTFLDGLNR